MSNKKITNIFLLSGLFCCALVSIYLIRKNTILYGEVASLESTVIDKECELIDFEHNIRSIYSNMGFYIDEKLSEAIYDNSASRLALINQKEITYVRISYINCWECISEISNVVNELNNENVIYLLNSPSEEMTEKIKATLNINNRVYIMVDNLELPIEKENKPYLFAISETNMIERVFIPIKGKEKLIKEYFNN